MFQSDSVSPYDSVIFSQQVHSLQTTCSFFKNVHQVMLCEFILQVQIVNVDFYHKFMIHVYAM